MCASGACGRAPKGICILIARFSSPRRSRVPPTFHQVTVVWKHLTHPKIAPLLGATIDSPQLISDRMLGGNLAEYIMSHSDADKPLRKRRQFGVQVTWGVGADGDLVSNVSASLYRRLTPHQLSDVAEGLSHMHSHNIIHGDLNGVHIVVLRSV